MPKSFEEELLDCKRYYQRLAYNDTGTTYQYIGTTYNDSTTSVKGIIALDTELRIPITPTATGTMEVELSTGNKDSTTYSFTAAKKYIGISITTSGITAGQGGSLLLLTDGIIECNAEL